MSKKDPIENYIVIQIESDAKITKHILERLLRENYPLSRFKIKNVVKKPIKQQLKVVICPKCKCGEIVTDAMHTNRFCNVCFAAYRGNEQVFSERCTQ